MIAQAHLCHQRLMRGLRGVMRAHLALTYGVSNVPKDAKRPQGA
jgi:hypothetical protein